MRRVTGEGEGRGVFPNQLISGGTAAAGYSLISTCYQPPAVGRAIHRRPRPALPSHLTDNERRLLPTMNTNRSLYIIAAHNAICVHSDRPGLRTSTGRHLETTGLTVKREHLNYQVFPAL